MNTNEFTNVLEEQIERSTNVLVVKANEYATDGDRLHNFKQAAHLQGITPREALGGMMAKHTVSIYDMCNNPEKVYSDEVINEKIGDHINYLLLLRAVFEDEKPKDDVSELKRTLNIVPQTQEDLDALRAKLEGTPSNTEEV